MNIAIIGCGYVGSAIAQHWKACGHHVTACTRQSSRVPTLKTIAGNAIVIQSNLYNVLSDCQAILLCMAPESTDQYENAYLETTRSLIRTLPQLPHLKQILYTSSTSVYGDHQGNLVDENTVLAPQSQNAQILIEAEQTLLRAEKLGREVCIFRLGEIYGPGREIAERLKRMSGKSFPGNGSNITNLIHLEDIVGALDFSLNKHLTGIYNLCNDLHIPRKEFYHQICKNKGLSPVTWNPSQPSLHAGNKIVSNKKLKDAGYQLIFNLT